MDENDWDIYYWVTGKEEIPLKHSEILSCIINQCNREGINRMPDL